MTNKYRQAELDSASTLYTVHRFRNEFGMTLRNELFGQPLFLLYTNPYQSHYLKVFFINS